MSEKTKIRITVHTDKVGSEESFAVFIDADDWAAMGEAEREAELRDRVWHTPMFDLDYEIRSQDTEEVFLRVAVKTGRVGSEVSFTTGLDREEWDELEDSDEVFAFLQEEVMGKTLCGWDWEEVETCT